MHMSKPAEPVVRAGRPAKLPEQIDNPELPDDLKARYAGKSVGLSLTIGADGRVKKASVISTLCEPCDKAAIEGIKRCRFKPAEDANGNPLEYRFSASVVF